MKLPRRKFLHLAAGIAAAPATARIAQAQAYPTGPVRLIVGFPAGGTNDVHARLIAEWLSKQFGRSFVVENRPGATGNIALEAVVRAAPDGYMLSVCGSTELRNEIIYTDLKFSFMRDTTPVASIYRRRWWSSSIPRSRPAQSLNSSLQRRPCLTASRWLPRVWALHRTSPGNCFGA